MAVVNQTFAKKYLAKTSPIGQRIRLAELANFPDKVEEPWFEVIGVVRDAQNQGLEDAPLPEAWLPYTVTGSGERGILVRTAGDPLAMLNAVRREIWATRSQRRPDLDGLPRRLHQLLLLRRSPLRVPDDGRSSPASVWCSSPSASTA